MWRHFTVQIKILIFVDQLYWINIQTEDMIRILITWDTIQLGTQLERCSVKIRTQFLHLPSSWDPIWILLKMKTEVSRQQQQQGVSKEKTRRKLKTKRSVHIVFALQSIAQQFAPGWLHHIVFVHCTTCSKPNFCKTYEYEWYIEWIEPYPFSNQSTHQDSNVVYQDLRVEKHHKFRQPFIIPNEALEFSKTSL